MPRNYQNSSTLRNLLQAQQHLCSQVWSRFTTSWSWSPFLVASQGDLKNVIQPIHACQSFIVMQGWKEMLLANFGLKSWTPLRIQSYLYSLLFFSFFVVMFVGLDYSSDFITVCIVTCLVNKSHANRTCLEPREARQQNYSIINYRPFSFLKLQLWVWGQPQLHCACGLHQR